MDQNRIAQIVNEHDINITNILLYYNNGNLPQEKMQQIILMMKIYIIIKSNRTRVQQLGDLVTMEYFGKQKWNYPISTIKNTVQYYSNQVQDKSIAITENSIKQNVIIEVLSIQDNRDLVFSFKALLQRFIFPSYKTGFFVHAATHQLQKHNKRVKILKALKLFNLIQDYKQERLIIKSGGVVLSKFKHNNEKANFFIDENRRQHLQMIYNLFNGDKNKYLSLYYERLRLAALVNEMDTSQYLNEFQVLHIESNEFSDLIVEKRLRNVRQVQLKMLAVKNYYAAEIWLQFMQFFNIYDISDEVCKEILISGVERPQMIHSVEGFAIASEVGSNKVFKTSISDDENGKEQQDRFLQKTLFENNVQNIDTLSQSEQEWDIVLIGFQYPKLGNVRMRSLSYFRSILSDDINLMLSYPQNIISLSLSRVSISNLQECTQLKNLFTRRCHYAQEQLCYISTIERFVSQDDKYNNDSLLCELFKQSKPAYIDVQYGKNIVGNIILDQNIENLKYLHSYNTDQKESIILNILNCYPKYLQVFHIQNFKTQYIKIKQAFRQQIAEIWRLDNKKEDFKIQGEYFSKLINKQVYVYQSDTNLCAAIIGDHEQLKRLAKQIIEFQADIPTPESTPVYI